MRRTVTTGDNNNSSTTPVPLTIDQAAQPRGMYPSVGGCDEFIRLLYYTKEVTQEYLDEIKGKATGNIEEGEVITLDLLPYDDLWWKSTDSKTLSSILLYEKLKAAGKIVEK
jgi:ADP-sugar diphosphatase